MTELDLDAARAARAEARAENPTVKFGGEVFKLPAELPMEFIWLLVEGEERKALDCLFSDDLERFCRQQPSREDIMAFFAGIRDLYGLNQGESSASAGSSSNGGNRSRLTSPTSIGSTSPRRASGRKR